MKNHTQNVVEKLGSDPLIKKNKITFKLRCWSLAFTLHKAFSKSRMRSGNSLATLFSPWFLRKNFSPYILLTEQTSLPDFLYFFRYLVIRTLQLQKQPSGAVLRKRCSENMQHICRRTPMPKWVFSCKFAAYFQNNFFQGTPLDGCFCNYLSFSSVQH